MFNVKAEISQSGDWNLQSLQNEIDKFAGQIKIGYFGHQPITDGTPNSITMVELATIHEYGLGHVPERSFLRASLIANQTRYSNIIKAKMLDILNERSSALQFKQKLGELAVKDVKEYVLTGSFKPLKPATIKRKRSSRPLIHTGRLRQSVTYQVEK